MNPTPNIVFVIPTYEDVKSLEYLMVEIAALPLANAHVIIVDDGSKRAPTSVADFSFLPISFKIIKLNENYGHQVAISYGLKYVTAYHPTASVVIMDSDGEDPPKAIPALYALTQSTSHTSVAGRINRQEKYIFKLGYLFYKIIFLVLTNRRINFGNFMVLPPHHAAAISRIKSTPIHLAATLINSGIPYTVLPVQRNKRYFEAPKMTYSKLVAHGLRSISIFGLRPFIILFLIHLLAIAYRLLPTELKAWQLSGISSLECFNVLGTSNLLSVVLILIATTLFIIKLCNTRILKRFKLLCYSQGDNLTKSDPRN